MLSDFETQMLTVVRRMKNIAVLPLVTLSSAASARELAAVLRKTGVAGIEVTYRSSQAAEAIAALRAEVPELLIAAGTVLTKNQIDSACDAGADVIVTPGLNPDNVAYCQQRGMPIIPGVNSPTHIEQAMGMGLRYLKFFPAEASGGVAFLKAVSGPYPSVMFMPTGGITADTVADYLNLPTVFVCGGSWVLDNALVDSGDWDGVKKHILQSRNRD